MRFAEFATYLDKLESTPSRLEITKILSQLINQLGEDEVSEGVFLSLGTIGPRYETVEFGLSEKLLMRVIARAFLKDPSQVEQGFK